MMQTRLEKSEARAQAQVAEAEAAAGRCRELETALAKETSRADRVSRRAKAQGGKRIEALKAKHAAEARALSLKHKQDLYIAVKRAKQQGIRAGQRRGGDAVPRSAAATNGDDTAVRSAGGPKGLQASRRRRRASAKAPKSPLSTVTGNIAKDVDIL